MICIDNAIQVGQLAPMICIDNAIQVGQGVGACLHWLFPKTSLCYSGKVKNYVVVLNVPTAE